MKWLGNVVRAGGFLCLASVLHHGSLEAQTEASVDTPASWPDGVETQLREGRSVRLWSDMRFYEGTIERTWANAIQLAGESDLQDRLATAAVDSLWVLDVTGGKTRAGVVGGLIGGAAVVAVMLISSSADDCPGCPGGYAQAEVLAVPAGIALGAWIGASSAGPRRSVWRRLIPGG